MNFFKNINEFYKSDLFTDLEIYVSNSSNLQIQKVCNCHRLILASFLPQSHNLLISNVNEDSVQLIIENYETQGNLLRVLTTKQLEYTEGISIC